MSGRDFTRSVRGLGPNHKKADCSHVAGEYRRSTDIEMSEAKLLRKSVPCESMQNVNR